MTKRALVLSGGGARGAYQIGVWAALKELQINIDIVVGTSIGALNGVLFAQDDFDLALSTWQTMSPDRVMLHGVNLDFDVDTMMSQTSQLELFLKQLFYKKSTDISPLRQLIDSSLKEKRLRSSAIRFGLCTLEVLPHNNPRYLTIDQIPEGKVADYLLASASIFPVFPLCEIDGRYFVDGGYHDNVPIRLADRMGADEFIVVDLKRRTKMDDKYRAYQKITYIAPFYDLGSFLNFDAQLARRSIILGYYDAMKRFHRYTGFVYTFANSSISIDNTTIRKFLHHQREIEHRFHSHPKFRSFFYRFRMTKIKNAIVMNDQMDDYAIGLRFSEIAGEVFDLDRYVVYDFYLFNRELEHRLIEIKQAYGDKPFDKKEAKKMEPVYLMVKLVDQFDSMMAENTNLDDYVFLTSLPENIVYGALYLYCTFVRK